MSKTSDLFHICHVMFSSGITRPEAARSLNEMKDLLKFSEEVNIDEAFKDLVEQGYVGMFENKYFLLGKGIVAVAAIFT